MSTKLRAISPSLAPAGSALVLDSEWTSNYTGETMRLLYWEKGELFFRKVRGLDGLVGQTFRLNRERFLAAYTPNTQALPRGGVKTV